MLADLDNVGGSAIVGLFTSQATYLNVSNNPFRWVMRSDLHTTDGLSKQEADNLSQCKEQLDAALHASFTCLLWYEGKRASNSMDLGDREYKRLVK